MAQKGREQLIEAGVTGEMTVERSADGRFVGQLHELNVGLPNGELSRQTQDEIRATFFARYREQYGHLPNNAGGTPAAIEFMSWRITVRGPQPQVKFARTPPLAAGAARKGSRLAYFGEHGWCDTPVYDRYALAAEVKLAGPAIIEERESTVILPPNMQAYVDGQLNLRIKVA